MNKRQIERAARLFMLSLVAKMDAGGADTDDETAVIERAIEIAYAKLAAMGHGAYFSLAECLAAAQRKNESL